MKKDKANLKQLIENNKQEMLQDSRVLEKIEQRIEEKLQQKNK